MNTDDLSHEQTLELYAAQIASNDRLIAVMESIETKLPAELRGIVAENRHQAAAVPVPTEPVDASPVVRQWGVRLMVAFVLCQIVTILVLLFK